MTTITDASGASAHGKPRTDGLPMARRQDYSLTDEQVALREVFGAFARQECTSSRVRAAEPLGHDPALWDKLMQMGV
jgi:hypothetical protein